MNFDLLFTIAFIMLCLDSIYLSLVSNHFGVLMKKIQGSELKVKTLPAIFCYLFLIFSIYYFIFEKKNSDIDSFYLGFVIYGVYELTNMAIITDWTWKTVFLDTVWGGILFFLTSIIVRKIHTS